MLKTDVPLPGHAAHAGVDNELRLRRWLWADGGALRAVRDLGLLDSAMRRFRRGLRTRRALRGDATPAEGMCGDGTLLAAMRKDLIEECKARFGPIGWGGR